MTQPTARPICPWCGSGIKGRRPNRPDLNLPCNNPFHEAGPPSPLAALLVEHAMSYDHPDHVTGLGCSGCDLVVPAPLTERDTRPLTVWAEHIADLARAQGLLT